MLTRCCHIILMLALGLYLPLCAWAVELTLPDPLAKEISEGRLATWEDNVIETQVGRDAIPSLTRPAFMDVSDASLVMEDHDVVFIADYGGQDVRIYPQEIMVWHQVVNDITDTGESMAVTYCPLTGTLTGYRARLDDLPLNFGVTGNIVNNNSILYDRNTASLWPQLTGIAYEGPLKGKRLQRFPLLWTRWREARQAYPNATVLSRSTGHSRSYDRDPYGNYANTRSYYHDEMIVYPLTNWDKRLPPKEPIYGVRGEDGQAYAVRKTVAEEKGVLNFWAGMTPMAAIYDPELGCVRVFERVIGEQTLDLELVGGEVRDAQSKSTWNARGSCISGAFWGESMPRVVGFDVFWFAYAAFFPSVETVPPLDGDGAQW